MKKKTKPFYHVRAAGPDLGALAAAFKKCGQIAQENSYAHVGLAVPAKGNLEGVISDLLGQEVTTILERKNVLDLSGLTMHLITRKINPRTFSGPVLAAYTRIDQTRSIADSPYCKALVYVPWQEDEIAEFEREFDSVVIYKSERLLN